MLKPRGFTREILISQNRSQIIKEFEKNFLTQRKIVYNPNRLSGIRRMNQLKNPIDSCVVLPDNRRTFDRFQSFVVALAKSQDHRVIYGVFCVWWLCNAVLSVVAFGIPCYTSELEQGRWAKDRAEWLG